MKVTYYVNGVDFKTMGVTVTASRGLLNSLKRKEPLKAEWPDHHGEVVDLAKPRFEAREIVLDCIITAASSTALIAATQIFTTAWSSAGTKRLLVDVNDGATGMKPLIYEVFLTEEIVISKKWRAASALASFKLSLREPEPLKMVYKLGAALINEYTASFEMTSPEPINIYWGDGTSTKDVMPVAGTPITHVYPSSIAWYNIVITGVIEDVVVVATNTTLVWAKL